MVDIKLQKDFIANRNPNKKINENSELRADIIPVKAKAAADKLQAELSKLLGSDYVVKVVFSTNLGSSIHVRIHDKAPVNNIAHNSPVFMQFMMYLAGSFGRPADLDKVSWEQSSAQRNQPKFRKISSKKSIEDANSKLIAWFKKNKKDLDKLLS